MESGGDIFYLGTSLKVFFIDLLMSADNAVLIALACRSLPPRLMRQAVLLGTTAAILLRVFFTTVVSLVLDLPGLKLAGACVLTVIAVKLAMTQGEHPTGDAGSMGSGKDAPDGRELTFWAAVIVVIAADAVMSLDNVVALAAVAQGSALLLTLGLLASIPLLMYGSLVVAGLLGRYPVLIPAGGALLGWVAGGMAVSDPAVAGWAAVQAPALAVALPFLGAIYVLLQSRIMERERRTTGAQRPADITIRLAAALSRFLGAGRPLPPLEQASPPPEPGTGGSGRQSPRPAHGLSEAPQNAEAHILVAVADPVERDWFPTAISSLGHASDLAGHGERAFHLLQDEKYKLLIVDRLLPGIDGLSLTGRIRAREKGTDRRLIVIVLTEEDQAFSTQQIFDAGLDDALVRPVTDENLESVLTFWLTAAGIPVAGKSRLDEAGAPAEPDAATGIAGLLKKARRLLLGSGRNFLLTLM